MQNYIIKARVIYETKAKSINEAVFNLYKAILPEGVYSYDEKTSSMTIDAKYEDAILVEEISQ